MIDWYHIGTNTLWILGLTLDLAIFSHATWQSTSKGVRLKRIMKKSEFQGWIAIANIFLCLGFATSSNQWFTRVFWILLSLIFILQILNAQKNKTYSLTTSHNLEKSQKEDN